MRLLVFGLSSQRGGVESFLITYCEEIYRLNHNIQFDFLVIDEKPPYISEYEDEPLFQNSTFYIVPSRTHGVFAYVNALKRLFASRKFNALWFNVCTLSDITPVVVASHFSVPCIVHSHNSMNMGNLINGALHNIHKKLVCRYATRFLACSDEAGAFMFPSDVLGSSRYSVLTNAIDTSRFTFSGVARESFRNRYSMGDCVIFGHVGRFHPQKNHGFLLEVFKELKDHYPHSKLLLIGDGYLEDRVLRYASELGISRDVLFAGQVKDVEDAYSAMDCFIFPSRYEGFGLAPLEAQAEGLPCAISDKCPSVVCAQPSCRRLSLTASAEDWCHEIIKLMKTAPVDRAVCSSLICNLGFDVSISAQKMIDTIYSVIVE